MKKPTRRKKGGQPANKNALKHGFYSKDFRNPEKARLAKIKTSDLQSELNLLRVHLDRLQKEIKYDEKKIKDGNGNQLRDSHYLSQITALSMMASSISTIARTIHFISGSKGGILDEIEEAFDELRREFGI